MAGSTLKSAKKELRLLMKQKLSEISKESINSQSSRVFESLVTFKPYREAKRIGIYLSMPTGEIQTDAIVRHALGSGKQVFVPYLHRFQIKQPDTPRSVMDMVDVRSLSNYDSLTRDSWGIPTIGADTVDERERILQADSEQPRTLDMILVPGVAFAIDSKSGFVRRLGHGKGFYDYFLHQYMKIQGLPEGNSTNPRTDVLLYGLALEEQFLQGGNAPSVPVEEHDSLLHGLFVGDATVGAGSANAE